MHRFQVGDRVKAVKWRDNGETAETLYYGRVAKIEGDSITILISRSKRGWKYGDTDIESPTNLFLISS